MRSQYLLKTIIEWSSLGVFLLIVLLAVANCKGDETDWQSIELDASQKADDKALESAVQLPKKTGAVWGKANPKTQTESGAAVEPKPIPAAKAQIPLPKVTAKTEINRREETGAKDTYLLQSSRKKGSADLVETLLEVSGTIKQMPSELNDKPVDNKMEVVAGFRYEERIAEMHAHGGGQVSVRQYNLAKSKMKIGDRLKTPELSSNLQTIVCTLQNDKVTLFSPNGALRGEQLLLIEDVPDNTLTIDRLLPDKAVKVGESWKISDGALRSFLSVDAVTESNTAATLTAVTDDMAVVEVIGDIDAVYLGASTEMHIRAKYQFDLKAKRINWVGLLIEENRSVGQVGPGLDLTAKLQVKISPLDAPQILTNDFMADINTEPADSVLELKYDGGKGPWRFAHNRNWYVFQDDPQATVLRKLDRGELIAQCNIADMGRVDVKTMTNIGKFQADLIAGLGKNFGKVVSAEKYTNKAGYNVFNVVIDGTVEDLSLRWIYNLLTDADGRQSVVVFVVETSKLGQFGNSDEVLLSTYRVGK